MKLTKENFLIYKNYKIIVSGFYLIVGFLCFYFWGDISNLYLDLIRKILQIGGTKSILLLIYFTLFNIYFFTYIAFIPLLEFDKKYEPNDRVKVFENNKISLKQFLKSTSVFILFPFLFAIAVGLLFILEFLTNIYTGVVATSIVVLLPLGFLYMITHIILSRIKKK